MEAPSEMGLSQGQRGSRCRRGQIHKRGLTDTECSRTRSQGGQT